ncbi:hypothetical protein Bbelb_077910 [Branchiostoma belcheri]|nr:hypothetical protein Bbelb_077910 [Branchiostoma belcheri]
MDSSTVAGWDDSFMYTHVDPDLLQERVALTSLGLGFARSRVINSKDRARKRIERLQNQFDSDYLTPSAAYGRREELHPERQAARHRNAMRGALPAQTEESWRPKSSFEKKLERSRQAARHRNAMRGALPAQTEDPWRPKSSFEKKLERSNNLVRTTRTSIRGMDDVAHDPYVMGIQSRMRMARKFSWSS